MTAYYNELDAFKAQVLREAIAAGAIAPGDVDERSIADVQPADLVGYTQCHFFAGGGFWSLALRQAGWPDDRPMWTGSCPCPSFSAAGKGEGFADPRHLWPEWYRLIRECRPRTALGEQVAAAIGHGWLDLVCGDLEAEGYAVAAAVLGAHSAGAPHIRQRLYFCAYSGCSQWPGRFAINSGSSPSPDGEGEFNAARIGGLFSRGSDAVRERGQQERRSVSGHEEADGRTRWDGSRPNGDHLASGDSEALSGADAVQPGRAEGRASAGDRPPAGGSGIEFGSDFGDVREWRGPGWLDPLTARSVAEAGATRGFWADCDWWYGRDGKYRPAGPGIFPLAYGSPARVGRLRLYGDAIVVPAAQAFIEAVIEVTA